MFASRDVTLDSYLIEMLLFYVDRSHFSMSAFFIRLGLYFI